MSSFSVDLTGHSALITGAGAGIGRAIAIALAASGAAVAISDLNIERAESVAEEARDCGGTAIALRADVSNRFQTANMIEQTRDAYGRINILVNAAGIFKAEPLLSIDEWDWRRQIEVNTTGVFFCMQLVGRVMADEGGGRIINLTSTAGYSQTLPAGMPYTASKASVIAMTRQAARELAPHGIRVNAIAAGNIEGDDLPQVAPGSVLLNRAGQPDDIAKAALFLCSDAADFITGQIIVVDGGSLA